MNTRSLGFTFSSVKIRVALMHFGSCRELDAGSADVPVRNFALERRHLVCIVNAGWKPALPARTSAFPAKLGFLILKLLHSRSFAREALSVRMLGDHAKES